MLKFIAQRWRVFSAAGLLLLVAAAFTWAMWPNEPVLAVVLGVSILVGGLGVLAFVRLLGAVRELFRDTKELKEFYAARSDVLEDARAEHAGLHRRLALVERRLAALAIKFDVTDELDDPRR